jgi:hypothetical protein
LLALRSTSRPKRARVVPREKEVRPGNPLLPHSDPLPASATPPPRGVGGDGMSGQIKMTKPKSGTAATKAADRRKSVHPSRARNPDRPQFSNFRAGRKVRRFPHHESHRCFCHGGCLSIDALEHQRESLAPRSTGRRLRSARRPFQLEKKRQTCIARLFWPWWVPRKD